jgi:hypothetical protein
MKPLWIIALIACTRAADAKPAPVVRTLALACSHSDMPFGRGSESNTTSYDLTAATRTTDERTSPGEDDPDRPPDKGKPPVKATHKHTVTKLAPARVSVLRAAANDAVAGGRYKDEYPVPEGTTCILTIADPNGTRLLKVEKSNPKIDDAATRLVKLFD